DEKRLEAARHWISRHGGEATPRDLYRYKGAGCTTAQDAETLLDTLVSHGYGTVSEKTPPTRGHPRKVFHIQICYDPTCDSRSEVIDLKGIRAASSALDTSSTLAGSPRNDRARLLPRSAPNFCRVDMRENSLGKMWQLRTDAYRQGKHRGRRL